MAKKATADTIKCISSAMMAGHNHGLEVYVPRTRLKPGGALVLDPPLLKFRPLLKIVIDEDAIGVGAANFLWTCAGVRGFHETDMCHRRDNDTHNSIKKWAPASPGQGHVPCRSQHRAMECWGLAPKKSRTVGTLPGHIEARPKGNGHVFGGPCL